MGLFSFRMLITIPIMLGSSYLNINSQPNSTYLMMMYILLSGITFIAHYLIKPIVETKNNRTEIIIDRSVLFWKSSKRTTYYEHEMEIITQKTSSAFMGFIMTMGICKFMGSNHPMLMQVVNMVFDLFGNKLIMMHLLNYEIDRPWEEKFPSEINELPSDLPVQDLVAKIKSDIVSVWDAKQLADYKSLYDETIACEESHIQTDDKKWSVLMILSGSVYCPPHLIEDLVLSKKSSPFLVDSDGWTALHWASYHNNTSAIDGLLESIPNLKQDLLGKKDKKGRTAYDIAIEEDNKLVIETIDAIRDW